MGSLTPNEMLLLPNLYRSTLSALSVARNITLDRNVIGYLESLTARAYFFVYGARARLFRSIFVFFLVRFPAAVRAAKWHIAASFVCVLFGSIVGYSLTLANEDWFFAFVSDAMAQGRTPETSTELLRGGLYDTQNNTTERLQIFASFLFTHNARIGILAFALGFAFGVPVILLLFWNGAILGAFVALFAGRGLGPDFSAWLFVHGTTELLAGILCGGAGLVIGSGVAFPGRHSRIAALASTGRHASEIVIGAVLLFFVAGLLEGFARQLITDMTERYLIGTAALVFWLLYFALAGRGEPDG